MRSKRHVAIAMVLFAVLGNILSCKERARNKLTGTANKVNQVSDQTLRTLESRLSSLGCKCVYPTIGRTSNESVLGIDVGHGNILKEVFAVLRDVPRMRTIVDLKNTRLGLTHEIRIPASVIEVRMWHVRICGDTSISCSTGLRYFALYNCDVSERSRIRFDQATHLRVLDIFGTHLDVSQAIGLGSLSELDKLILDERSSLLATAMPRLKKCRILSLHGKKIRSPEINRIICENDVLQFVSLSETSIDDSTLFLLSRIRPIVEINVSDTSATTKGIQSLLNLRGLSSLIIRDLRVEPELIDRFKTKGVNVVWYRSQNLKHDKERGIVK